MKAPQWLRALGIPDDCISRASSAREGKCSFVINAQPDDQVWRVKVDGCWIQSGAENKVDYLFWGQSASGRKVVLLVELKGGDLGKALRQVEGTLERLCKRADGGGIHTGDHQSSPGHDLSALDGVQAYVVLNKSVPQRLRDRELLRKRYQVRVRTKTKSLKVSGLDALP